MIVVIQCAASKQDDAPSLRTADGREVCFVADPSSAPASGHPYARPDDMSGSGESWREQLRAYNEAPDANPLRLLRAYELYRPSVYQDLADHVGTDRLYILSAGWGLIPATYMTPAYDITFSASADPWKRRRKSGRYDDFSMLPEDTREPVLFFGGNDYLPLFARLTRHLDAPKIIPYRSAQTPDLPGATLVRFETERRTNWHYECAEAFMRGALDLPH